MKNFSDNLYMIWTIARKDIGNVLKNRGSLANLFVIIVLVLSFYVLSTVRPWDKSIEVVVYDEGDTGLFEGTLPLSDGYEIYFIEVTSLGQMKRNMRYEHWGLVVPEDFEQTLASGGEVALTGYLSWVYRGKVTELETLYSEKLSELLGQPVSIEIGENIVIPSPEIPATMVNQNVLFAIFFMALTLLPALMLEEKQTKTLDALLVSPASAGQIVMGKAVAGLFYVTLTGGLFFALHSAYVYNWDLALLGFLLSAAFCIGLALALGSVFKTAQQAAVWMVPVAVGLIIPMIFAGFNNLAPGLRTIFSLVPTTALVEIFQYSFSSGVLADRLLADLASVIASCALVYGVVIWKVRRSDR